MYWSLSNIWAAEIASLNLLCGIQLFSCSKMLSYRKWFHFVAWLPRRCWCRRLISLGVLWWLNRSACWGFGNWSPRRRLHLWIQTLRHSFSFFSSIRELVGKCINGDLSQCTILIRLYDWNWNWNFSVHCQLSDYLFFMLLVYLIGVSSSMTHKEFTEMSRDSICLFIVICIIKDVHLWRVSKCKDWVLVCFHRFNCFSAFIMVGVAALHDFHLLK